MTDYSESMYDDSGLTNSQSDGGEYGGDYGASSPSLYDDFDLYAGADYGPQDQWASAMGGGVDEWGEGNISVSGNTVTQNMDRAQWAPNGDQAGGGLGGYAANMYAPKPGKSGADGTGVRSTGAARKAARQVVQISRQQFEGVAPTLDLPTYDEREIKRMTQEELSPAVRELRAGFRRAMLQTYENPNVRGSVLAKALEGYGIGVGRAMAGARSSATQRYQQQYGISRENAMAKFTAALDAYKRTARTIQIQQPYTTEAGLEEITKKNYGIVAG